jgi:hypothetical protein
VPDNNFAPQVTYTGKGFDLRIGKQDQPGWMHLTGVPQADGGMRLLGGGVSRIPAALGKPYQADIHGRFRGDRYEGSGKAGVRDCKVTIARGTGQAGPRAPIAATSWSGMLACGAFRGAPAQDFRTLVTVVDDNFEVRKGRPDRPGWLLVKGMRQPDGTLRLTGTGISGGQNVSGRPITAEFEGKVVGERYEAPGRLGRRDCTLKITRR